MALTVGTNCGFVTVAPVDDPVASSRTLDTYALVSKFTSPAGATKIVEIGWYCSGDTEEANWEGGLYAADGAVVPGEAGTRLYVSDTNAKGTTAGWKKATVDWSITGETAYWAGVQLDDTTTLTYMDYSSSGGDGYDALASQTSLPNPFGGGAIADTDGYLGIYLVYEITSTYTITYDGNGNTGGDVPVDGSSPYAESAEVTVLGNTGSLVKTGYTWGGWNTAADGSGTSYAESATFNMPAANTTLYAIWLMDPITPTVLDTIVGASYDTDTGYVTSEGEFSVGYKGRWAHITEGAAGAWVEAWYQIIDADADSIFIGYGIGSNTDIDVEILSISGGTFANKRGGKQ